MIRTRTGKALGLAFSLGLLLAVASSAQAKCPGDFRPAAGAPLEMLVLGDSIMWGQGLKPEQKFPWRLKCWLQEKTNREVIETVFAHSGALIARATEKPRFESNDGEVNLPYPSINEELDHALAFYGPGNTKVNLILLDGCINDVDVSNLLNVTTDPNWLRERINTSCKAGMHDLLKRVIESFPNAQVIVPSYYRIVSDSTADNAFIRLLAKKLNNERPEARRLSDKEMRERLIKLSELWYRASSADLRAAVDAVNNEVSTQGLPPRVSFVEIDFWPEHSFSAAETLLWNFIFGSTNLSGLRKFLIIISFGTSAYKPNDEVRESRNRSCKETFKEPKGIKETPAQKSERKDRLLICRYAALGHPNEMGALVYTEAIKGHLQWMIDKVGWRHEKGSEPAPKEK
ncbi:MAG TPA: SGNH/GDSL hydrolase family protein [Pyrinomonadaceae bacterium]|nr:SGNH/GDSL hydrolase family protein [Pyrinomonadaceae bacterium]